jgi:RNA polymerase sigma-54 factor
MLKHQLQLKLQQKLSPQQIQLMKLLQVPTAELEQRIKDEIQENPALEEGSESDESDHDSEPEEIENESDYYDEDEIPDYKTSIQNKGKDEEDKQTPLGQGYSFQDALYSQLTLLDIDEEDSILAEYLIGNLEDDGYLRRDLASICNDLVFTANIQTNVHSIEKALGTKENGPKNGNSLFGRLHTYQIF